MPLLANDIPTDLQPVDTVPADLAPAPTNTAEVPDDLKPTDWHSLATSKIQDLGLDPLKADDASQMLAIYDAHRKMFGTPNEAAAPTYGQKLVGQQQDLQQQANAGRGQAASFALEALHPAAQVMAGIENAVAPAVGLVSPSAANNITQHAGMIQDIRGDQNSAGGIAGSLVGNLPVMANPLLAGAVAGGETYHNIEQQKAAGADISGTNEALDVAGQAVLNGAMSYLFGKNVTGGLARTVEQQLATRVPALIAKYGAKAAIGAAINEVQGIVSNQVTKSTVNPNQDVLEGSGRNAVFGAGMEVGMTGLHDLGGYLQGQIDQPAAAPAEPTPVAPPTDTAPVGTGSAEQPAATQTETPAQPPAAAGLDEQGILNDHQTLLNLKGQLQRGELEGDTKTQAEQQVDHLAATVQDRLNTIEEQHGSDASEALFEKIAGMKETTPGSPERVTQIADTSRPVTERTGLDDLIAKGKELLTSDSGGMNLKAEDLTGPGSIYHEEVKPPLQKLADAGREIFRGIRSLFPMETGGGDKATADIAREHFSRAKLDQQKAEIAFEEAKQGFNKLGQSAQWGFQANMDANQPQATPELQKIADAMYKDTNEGRQRLVALGQNVAKGWQQEWWNRLWKVDPTKAATFREQMQGPGKIEGRAGFMKSRSIEDWHDALAQGLVPKYDNPVDMFLATRAERQKYIAGFGAMKELVGTGDIKRGDSLPPGWVKLDPRTAGPLKDLLPGDGFAMAPEPVARVLKNVVTPSAIGNSKAFRVLMDANNTITQSLLGLSGFHVRKVTQELINLNVARAIESMAHGDAEGAKASLLKAPTSPIDAIRTGSDIQKVMLGMKQAANPEQVRTIDAMITGGMSAKGDSVYETQWKSKFQKAVADSGVQGLLRAIGYAPLAANEHIMQKGIFQYVQHAKIFVGYEMARDALARLDAKNGPGNTLHEELRAEMGKISDHLDNVLGLMNRDNLFWNRTARDLATLSTLSVGWNYGSGRALAGGLYDLGKGSLEVARGGKLADVDSRRISYLASTAMLTALAGAVTTYMATGHGPKSLMDYVYPDTGDKDRSGHSVRMNTGFYTSDWFDFLHNPTETAKNKASPILHDALALAENKDYQGVKIRNEDDKWYQQAGQVARYLGKSATPLGVQQLINTIEGGGSESKSASMKAAALAGFRTAKKSYSMSDAENLMHDLMARHYEVGGRTQEQADKTTLINKLADDLRNNEPNAGQQFRRALRDKKIQPADAEKIRRLASGPGGMVGALKNSAITPDEMMQVWAAASPDERKQIAYVVRGRIANSQSIDAETKRKYLRQIIKEQRAQ